SQGIDAVVRQGVTVNEATDSSLSASSCVSQTSEGNPMSSNVGRGVNKTHKGRGKDPVLLRLHYGVMRLRQARITEFLAREKKRREDNARLCENCRALIPTKKSDYEYIDLVSDEEN
ncbi:hypothetical protein PMAYCL1PPCAC_25531, partial [Pristionchus mayeri]